jgi:hypothetical protein
MLHERRQYRTECRSDRKIEEIPISEVRECRDGAVTAADRDRNPGETSNRDSEFSQCREGFQDQLCHFGEGTPYYQTYLKKAELMSEFEFLAVLLSIVFGLALTQILSGAIRLFYEQRVDDVHLAWALVVALALIINWWGFFQWSGVEQWRFELYAFLMVWATTHYALAATLFPIDSAGRFDPERQRRVFLVTFLAVLGIDVIEAGLRDGLLTPWYYLPGVASWALAATVALAVRQRRIERYAAWYTFLSILFFALVARRLLPV